MKKKNRKVYEKKKSRESLIPPFIIDLHHIYTTDEDFIYGYRINFNESIKSDGTEEYYGGPFQYIPKSEKYEDQEIEVMFFALSRAMQAIRVLRPAAESPIFVYACGDLYNAISITFKENQLLEKMRSSLDIETKEYKLFVKEENIDQEIVDKMIDWLLTFENKK